MRVLVTGGAGFIGSYLIKYWLARDRRVRIVNFDKLTYCGDLGRVKELKRHPRYQFVRGDVARPDQVRAVLKRCDAVVHLAAETHVDRSLLDGGIFFRTNTYGTYVLLEAACERGIKKFLTVSTDEVYGSRERGFFTEADDLSPTSPYAVSKTAADLLTLAYANTHGLFTSVTRGSNTYGPYQYPEKVMPLFVSNALVNKPLPLYGDGKHIRNWMHVEDHCRGILTVFRKGKKGEAYNIATSNYLTNRDLTERLLKILRRPRSLIHHVKDRVGHDRRYAIRAAKLGRLGWKPRVPFGRGLKETVAWYETHEAWWRDIKEKNKAFKTYYAKAYRGRR